LIFILKLPGTIFCSQDFFLFFRKKYQSKYEKSFSFKSFIFTLFCANNIFRTTQSKQRVVLAHKETENPKDVIPQEDILPDVVQSPDPAQDLMKKKGVVVMTEEDPALVLTLQDVVIMEEEIEIEMIIEEETRAEAEVEAEIVKEEEEVEIEEIEIVMIEEVEEVMDIDRKRLKI